MKKVYSPDELHRLDEVAAMYLSHLKDGPRWLSDKVRQRELKAVKLGRAWYMANDHVAHMLKRLSNEDEVDARAAQPEQQRELSPSLSIVEGLSDRSRRRLKRVVQ